MVRVHCCRMFNKLYFCLTPLSATVLVEQWNNTNSSTCRLDSCMATLYYPKNIVSVITCTAVTLYSSWFSIGLLPSSNFVLTTRSLLALVCWRHCTAYVGAQAIWLRQWKTTKNEDWDILNIPLWFLINLYSPPYAGALYTIPSGVFRGVDIERCPPPSCWPVIFFSMKYGENYMMWVVLKAKLDITVGQLTANHGANFQMRRQSRH